MKNLMNEETLHPARRYAQLEWDPTVVQYVWTYAYDGRYRLTSAQRYDAGDTLEYQETYTYDAGDNLLTRAVYVPGSGTSTNTFAYNAANEQTSMNLNGWGGTCTYDAWGRLTNVTDGSQDWDYAYNYGGKLTQWDGPDDWRRYKYGGDGKRRARYRVYSGSYVGTWYNWDAGWTVINEEEVDDMTGAGTTLERTYVGKTLGHADGANPATGTWYIYATDIQGSIYGVNQGAYQMEFTPYGSLYASTGSVDQFTHRWAQLEWQSPESLYFAPYRWYSPNSIHWLTRDPLGMVDGPNVYAYVKGDPVNAVDPMGLLIGDVFEAVKCWVIEAFGGSCNDGDDDVSLPTKTGQVVNTTSKLAEEVVYNVFDPTLPGSGPIITAATNPDLARTFLIFCQRRYEVWDMKYELPGNEDQFDLPGYGPGLH